MNEKKNSTKDSQQNFVVEITMNLIRENESSKLNKFSYTFFLYIVAISASCSPDSVAQPGVWPKAFNFQFPFKKSY